MIELRDVLQTDAQKILTWKKDPYIIKMALDTDDDYSLNDILNDINHSIEGDYSDYKIITCLRKPIGYVRIDWVDHQKRVAWLRFALGEERGNGYMRKALKQYIKRCFKMGCHRIECKVYDFNIPSIKTLKSLGFVKEGIKRKAHHTSHAWTDIICYGLLKTDFIGTI